MNNVDTFQDKAMTSTSMERFQAYINETYGSGDAFADHIIMQLTAESGNDANLKLVFSNPNFKSNLSSSLGSYAEAINPQIQGSDAFARSAAPMATASASSGSDCPFNPFEGADAPWFMSDLLLGTGAGLFYDLAENVKPYLTAPIIGLNPITGEYSPYYTPAQTQYLSLKTLSNVMGKVAAGVGGGFAAWELGTNLGTGDYDLFGKNLAMTGAAVLIGAGFAAFWGPGLVAGAATAGTLLAVNWLDNKFLDPIFDDSWEPPASPTGTPCQDSPLPDWLLPAGGKFGNAPNIISPLVLDLDGDGIETGAMGYGVGASTTYFDMDNDGFAERTGWAAGGDGLLALDKNGNGKIDNQSELFGNSAPHIDGFAALKSLDTNNDNRITSADSQWNNLRIWIDANNDGGTDTGELRTLSSLNITQISLATTQHSNLFNNENPVTASSTFVMNGQNRIVSDVWFRSDQMDTRFRGDYTLDPKTLFLPTLKGFGNLKDLHIAMSGDAVLLTLVENFTKNWSMAKFANTAGLDSEIKSILFKWAGVDTVAAGSRGTYVDAQAISFMEKLTGQYWGGGTTPRNPTAINQGAETIKAFEMAFSALKAHLIVQTGASSLFENPPIYNFVDGNLTEGVLSASGIAALAAQAPDSNATTALKQSYWNYIANFLLSTKDYADFTAAEKASLTNAIGASINGMTFDSLVASIPVYAANFVSTEFSDFIVGARGSDTLSGKGGDDILKGLGGNDSVNGGTGNDTYIYSRGDGYDLLSDTSGNDTLAMQGNITLSDISFQRFDANDLYVYLNGEQIIRIFENYKTSTSVLENITFANGTSFNLSEVGSVAGDNMANTLNGIDHALLKDDSLFGNDGNDILDGRQGNDYLYGGAGDDTYIYNPNSGRDIIKDDSGKDTISFGSGIIAANINWERTGTYDLLIKSGSTDIILIQNYYLDNGSIETLKFSNGATINLSGHYYTLNGTAGNDNLQSLAIGGNDIIFGLEGDDRINARAGDDIVYGGLGNDQIYTDFGNDTIVYEGGVDEYYDFGGTDVIKITDATINVSNITFRKTTQYDVEVLLKGQSAFIIKGQFWQQNGYERIEFANGAFLDLDTVSYQLTATTGNDNLYGIGFGGNPNDIISGLAGNDIIYGYEGNDTLDGGSGNDTIDGGLGDDTYKYNLNEGLDKITDQGGNDTIILGSGLAQQDITYVISGKNLLILHKGVQILELVNHLNTGYGIETIRFANGTEFKLSDIVVTLMGTASADNLLGQSLSETILGLAGNDMIAGGGGNDVITGGTGSDGIDGNIGDDTYIYAPGDSLISSRDTIHNYIGEGIDTIRLTGVQARDVLIWTDTAMAGRMIIQYTPNDQIMVQGWQRISPTSSQTALSPIERIVFDDGTVWDFTTGIIIRDNEQGNYIQTGDLNDKIAGNGGNDSITALGGNDEVQGNAGDDALRGGLGDDILTGGIGRDTLDGETGNDTYVFSVGDSLISAPDLINYNQGEGVDTIRLTGGILPQNVTVWKEQGIFGLLNIQYSPTDKIQIQGWEWVTSTSKQGKEVFVEKIAFDNGTILNIADLLNPPPVQGYNPTAGNDSINASAATSGVTIDLLAGNDTFTGSAYNDTITGGAGTDTLNGGAGNDIYNFSNNTGLDTITDGSGIDRIVLGNGITSSNVSYLKIGNDLSILLLGTEVIKIIGHYAGTGAIETLQFADGTTVNLTTLIMPMNGTTGNDTLNGTSGDDVINGLTGNDTLNGNGGNDTFDGGAGTDAINGGAGNDTYNIASGSGLDTITDTSGTDRIVFGTGILQANTTYARSGNDLMISVSGTQIARIVGQYAGTGAVETLQFSNGTTVNLTTLSMPINGTTGNDTLNGTSGDDVINGLAGNDTLNGNGGNDTFDGGAGTDAINGGAGNDTYNIASGSGLDTITDTSGTDRIVLGTGILQANTTYARSGNDLTISVSGTQIARIVGHYAGTGAVETLQFSDGTTVNLTTLNLPINGTTGNDTLNGTSGNDVINGLAGNDTLNGNGGNDTFDGGAGTDTINGGAGNDTYNIASGSGLDTITDTAGTDKIVFGSGLARANMALARDTTNINDLAVSFSGTRVALVKNFFTGTNQVETIQFSDGSTYNLLTHNFLLNGTTAADTLTGYSGMDTLRGGAGNDTIYGGAGNDTLFGDAGNDTLRGEAGNDIYVFDGGLDRIHETGGTDTLQLGAGMTVDALVFSDVGTVDTKMAFSVGVNEVTLYGQRGTDANVKVETVTFLDGFSANLTTYKSWVWGTTAAQTTNGTTGVDTILGRGGNDTINGNAGNDALHGGAGNDTVRGGDGNDLVHGGVGNDTLYGDAGNDVLYGDDGLDNLYGGAGADTFKFLKETAFRNIDVINDFNRSQSDKIDISSLLQGYDPLTNAITDFVQITTSGANSILRVDVDGGANNFVQIATLNNVTGLTDEQVLVNSGNLVVS